MICNIFAIYQGRRHFGQLHIGHIDHEDPDGGKCVVLLNHEWNERMTAAETAKRITGEVVDGLAFWKLSRMHRPISQVVDERWVG